MIHVGGRQWLCQFDEHLRDSVFTNKTLKKFYHFVKNKNIQLKNKLILEKQS